MSPAGRATGCKIRESAGFFEMSKALCDAFMRRARFTIATDAAGTPVAGRFEAKATWTQP